MTGTTVGASARTDDVRPHIPKLGAHSAAGSRLGTLGFDITLNVVSPEGRGLNRAS